MVNEPIIRERNPENICLDQLLEVLDGQKLGDWQPISPDQEYVKGVQDFPYNTFKGGFSHYLPAGETVLLSAYQARWADYDNLILTVFTPELKISEPSPRPRQYKIAEWIMQPPEYPGKPTELDKNTLYGRCFELYQKLSIFLKQENEDKIETAKSGATTNLKRWLIENLHQKHCSNSS